MIIFYLKATGEIIGTVNGRVHDKDQLKKLFIKPANIPKKDIGKYIIPFKTKYKVVEEPVYENRIINNRTLAIGRVLVGKKKVKKGAGMFVDAPFANLIYDIESGKKSIYDYRLKLKNEKVIGFEKKPKN